jgi:hypothetical protein
MSYLVKRNYENDSDISMRELIDQIVKLRAKSHRFQINLVIENWFDLDDDCLILYLQNSGIEPRAKDFFDCFVRIERSPSISARVMQNCGPEFVFDLAMLALEPMRQKTLAFREFFTNSISAPVFFDLLEDTCLRQPFSRAFFEQDFIDDVKIDLERLVPVLTTRQLCVVTTIRFCAGLEHAFPPAYLAQNYFRFGLVDFTLNNWGEIRNLYDDNCLLNCAVFEVLPEWITKHSFDKLEWARLAHLLQCYKNRSMIVSDDLQEKYRSLCRKKKSLITNRLFDICFSFYWLPALLQLAIVDHDEPALSALVRTSTKYEMIATIKRKAN